MVDYKHLTENKFPLPWLIDRGYDLIGTREIVGDKHSPLILKWAKDLGLQNVYRRDEIPWCGLYVAKVCQLAEKPVVKNPLWARNWLKWGIKVSKAGLGDILIFKRGSGGHVGFYIGEDSSCYYVLGGNQNNMVNITRIAKNRLLGARRAKYNNTPKSVKGYVLNRSGVTLSTNEA